jgi:NADH:ubiquinone oxidoreductase subunit 4 (subunit M)
MKETRREVPVAPVSFAPRLAIAVCLIVTIYLGVFPGSVLQYAQDSAQQLVQQPLSPIPSKPAPAAAATL